MTVDLPPALAEAHGWVGVDWPHTDEDALFAAADAWTRYAARVRALGAGATADAASVWDGSSGESIRAFRAWWEDGPQRGLAADAAAADVVATMLELHGALTLGLKQVYLAQLAGLTAEITRAVSAAFVTAGASLSAVPAAAAGVRATVRQAVDDVTAHVPTADGTMGSSGRGPQGETT